MRVLFFVMFFLSQAGTAYAANFLEPEQAFKFSAHLIADNRIEIDYDIAPGYYLYRNKFKFSAEGATLGTPVFPAGETKQDPNFGTMEIYHRSVAILIPYHLTAAMAFRLQSVAQGCAEAGICYTPITNEARFTAPANPPAVTQSITPAQNRHLPHPPSFLSPDQAFRVQLVAVKPDTLQARFTVAPRYYLYQDKLHFAVKQPAGVRIKTLVLPTPEIKSDPNFGQMKVYHHDFAVNMVLSRPLTAGEKVQISAGYQGCSELGICYPPQTQVLAPGNGANAAAPHSDVAAAPANSQDASLSNIERVLHGGNFWIVIATFFGAGVLLALTPCVFPMIPILSGIIAGQRHVTRLSSFLLALAYVLGMAITYALVGVVAALSGTLISNTLQNPVALSIGAALFVALALSMFGLFELQLPSFIQSKFSDASNRVKGGNFAGVFVMGALSALIVGPCVAPPLAAALAYIAKSGNTLLGGWALFSLAIGMGMPLLLVGLSAGALLPRAGSWMNAIKNFFGVLMLGVAIWLITPLIAVWLQMLLWAALLVLSAVYWHALDALPQNASGLRRLWKGFAVLLLLAGAGIFTGMMAGGRDILQPLAIFHTAAAPETAQTALEFQPVRNLAELDSALAHSDGKPVMLDFYADWCTSCKEMARDTFDDPVIRQRLAKMTLLQADITANTPNDDALRKRFGVFGPPALIFFNAHGKEIPEHVIGYQTPAEFSQTLNKYSAQ
ncbi:MAG TPA: protein-disulfide reductase DsbD [Burkholderiales bacterium]|nr:protein-disulfide reductase DsbD [Burkholderiales bacterium]